MPHLVADLVGKPIEFVRRRATGGDCGLGLPGNLLNVSQRALPPLLVSGFDKHNVKLLLFVERESGGFRQGCAHGNGQAADGR
ncbi:MAG TPA: hypothetical protein VHV55_16700 [Pirellulales bacterium]|jgi:hypothetical protein|nr:hypothetical protein [Pirellulales bacterium]